MPAKKYSNRTMLSGGVGDGEVQMENREYGREREVGGDAVYRQEREMHEREIEKTKRKKRRRKQKTREGVAFVHGMDMNQEGERTDEEGRKEEKGNGAWKHSGQEKGEKDMGMEEGRREEQVSHRVEAEVKTEVEGEKVKKKRKGKRDEELEPGEERKAEVTKESGRDAEGEIAHMKSEVKVEVRKKPGREVNAERDRFEPDVKTEVDREKVEKSRKLERGNEGLEHGKERKVEADDMKKTGRKVKGENYCMESHVKGEARREVKVESDILEPDVETQIEGEKLKKKSRKERGEQSFERGMERKVKAEVKKEPGWDAEGEDCWMERKAEAEVTKNPGREAKGGTCHMERKAVAEQPGREVRKENGCMDNEVQAGARKKPEREANGENGRMESVFEAEVSMNLGRQARGENLQLEDEKEATVEGKGRRKKVRQKNVFEYNVEADEGKEKRKEGCTLQSDFGSEEVEKAKSRRRKEKAVSVHGEDLEGEKWQDKFEKAQIVSHLGYIKGEASCGLWGSPAAIKEEEKARTPGGVKRMELDGEKEESPRKERKRKKKKNRERRKDEVVEEDEPVMVTRLDMGVLQQVEKHGGEDGRMEAVAEEGELECLEGKLAESGKAKKKGSKKKRATRVAEGDFEQPSPVPPSDDLGEEDKEKNRESNEGEVVKEAEPVIATGLDMDVVQRVDEHGGQGGGMEAVAKEGEPECVKGDFMKGKVAESGKMKKGVTKKRREARLFEGDLQQPSPALLSDDLGAIGGSLKEAMVVDDGEGGDGIKQKNGEGEKEDGPQGKDRPRRDVRPEAFAKDDPLGISGSELLLDCPDSCGEGGEAEAMRYLGGLQELCFGEGNGAEDGNLKKKKKRGKKKRVRHMLEGDLQQSAGVAVDEATIVAHEGLDSAKQRSGRDGGHDRVDCGGEEGEAEAMPYVGGLQEPGSEQGNGAEVGNLKTRKKRRKKKSLSRMLEGDLQQSAGVAVDEVTDVAHEGLDLAKQRSGRDGGGDKEKCVTGSSPRPAAALHPLEPTLKNHSAPDTRAARFARPQMVAYEESKDSGLRAQTDRWESDTAVESPCVEESHRKERKKKEEEMEEPVHKEEKERKKMKEPKHKEGKKMEGLRCKEGKKMEELSCKEGNEVEGPTHKGGKSRKEKMEESRLKEGEKMELLHHNEGKKLEELSCKEGKKRTKKQMGCRGGVMEVEQGNELFEGGGMGGNGGSRYAELQAVGDDVGYHQESAAGEDGGEYRALPIRSVEALSNDGGKLAVGGNDDGAMKKRRRRKRSRGVGTFEKSGSDARKESEDSARIETEDSARNETEDSGGLPAGKEMILEVEELVGAAILVEEGLEKDKLMMEGGLLEGKGMGRRKGKKRRKERFVSGGNLPQPAGVAGDGKSGVDCEGDDLAKQHTETVIGGKQALQVVGAASRSAAAALPTTVPFEAALETSQHLLNTVRVNHGHVLSPLSEEQQWVPCEPDGTLSSSSAEEKRVEKGSKKKKKKNKKKRTVAEVEVQGREFLGTEEGEDGNANSHIMGVGDTEEAARLGEEREEGSFVMLKPEPGAGMKKKKRKKRSRDAGGQEECDSLWSRDAFGDVDVDSHYTIAGGHRDEAEHLEEREEGDVVVPEPMLGAGMEQITEEEERESDMEREENHEPMSADEDDVDLNIREVAGDFGEERGSDMEREENHAPMSADEDDADLNIQEVAGDLGAEPSSAQANEMPNLAHVPDERRCRRSGGWRVRAKGVRTSWRCPLERTDGSVYCASHIAHSRATTPGRRLAPPPDPLPDSQRCTRTCGPKWRCSRPRMPGKKRCDVHQEMLDGAAKKRVWPPPQVGWNGKWSLGGMPGLGILGSDITMKILSSVPYEHVMKARLVCKGWRNAVNECDDLWEEMYDSCWGLPPVRPLGRGLSGVLTWKAAFLQRLKVQHDTKNNCRECPFCGRAFRLSNRTHILSHTVRLVCEWPECGSIFHQQRALHEHVVQAHGGAKEPAVPSQNPELSAPEGGAQFLDPDEDANLSDWEVLSWDSNPRWAQPFVPQENRPGWEQPPAPPPAQPLSNSDDSSAEDEIDSLPRLQLPAQAQAQQPPSSDDSSSEDESDSLPRLQPPAQAQARQSSASDDSSSEDESDSLPRSQPPAQARHLSTSDDSSSEQESDQLQRQRPRMQPFAISEEDTSDFDSDA